MKIKLIVIAIVIIGIIIAIDVSAPFSFNLSFVRNIFANPLSLLLILFAILLQLTGSWIRAQKQGIILQKIRPVKILEIFKGQTIGSLFNAILPFRLGELVRANYVARGVSISRSAVFATIVFERFIDLIILVALGLILITIGTTNNIALLPVLLFLSSLIFILGFLLYSARQQKIWLLKLVFHFSKLFNENIRNTIRMIAWSGIYILKNAITKKNLPKYLGLTLIMWVFYIASTLSLCYVLLAGFGFGTQFNAAVSAYFGISVPSGPAYLGTFQNVFTSISGISVDYLHENNITFFIWLLLILPTAVLGIVFLLLPQKIYAKTRNEGDELVEALKNKLYRDVDITDEFAHFLDSYFRGSTINRILSTEELTNRFQVIKTFKGGSNALTLLVWQDGKMVVKKITLKQYRDKLKAQYDWLYERRSHKQITKVLGEYDDQPNYYALDIEYRDTYITFFDYIHSSSLKEAIDVLSALYKFVDKNIYKPIKKIANGKQLLDEYVETKVIGKVSDAASMNTSISNLMSYDTIVINGKEYDNFDTIIKRITNDKRMRSDLTKISESPIHGDLTVDNLIVDPNNGEFILLDPNNENSISDATVDYAKMMQSLHSGYEFLYGIMSCRIDKNAINFEESRSAQYGHLYEAFDAMLKKDLPLERYRSILFHEAVHYCRMLTYRCDINPRTAAVFYAIAVRLFNQYTEQYGYEKK